MSLNVSDFFEDIHNVGLLTEYIRPYFSTADADVSNNYPCEIIKSVSISNLIISEYDVVQALRSLKYTYAPESDGISLCILKLFSGDLCCFIYSFIYYYRKRKPIVF